MKCQPYATELERLRVGISALARDAVRVLPPGAAQREAYRRSKSPIDYMRCAELPAVLMKVDLLPGMRVLDVGSPQWFSLFLAAENRQVDFSYVNISEAEVAVIKDIARVLNIQNIHYHTQDVKRIGFADTSFDCCLSISVIEHIEPEVGGDVLALREMRRVLRPGADVWVSVPLKDSARVLYSRAPGWEGQRPNEQGRYFFAREYSDESWAQTMSLAGLTLQSQSYIIEVPGPLAIDYWTYGPQHNSVYGIAITRLMNGITRWGRFSWEMKLAHQKLRLSDQPGFRLANLAAHYRVPV